MTFIEWAIKLTDELADAKECEFWECPPTGPEPHNEHCLTGHPCDE